MTELELADSCFAAWNAHDADAIVAAFAHAGTYTDPTMPGPLTGAAIGDYAQSLWAGFPDLTFEVRHRAQSGPNRVIGEWTMRGTNTGAFSVTSIRNAAEEDAEIRELSRATAKEMLEMEGFIGLTLVRAGGRGITISAWEKPEHAKQLYQSGAHRQAMARFWQDLGDAAFTSVWPPERINPFWVRCRDCGKMTDHEKSAGKCGCGGALPDAPPWF
jgi:heme-degrading monooxygenase HmoA